MSSPYKLYEQIDFLHEHMHLTCQDDYIDWVAAAAGVEKSVVVVPDMEYKRQYKDQYPRGTIFVSLNALKSLRGRDLPMLFTPEALMALFEHISDELMSLKEVRAALGC
jgi:hypothetical protein